MTSLPRNARALYAKRKTGRYKHLNGKFVVVGGDLWLLATASTAATTLIAIDL
jgi:hypothetical protein